MARLATQLLPLEANFSPSRMHFVFFFILYLVSSLTIAQPEQGHNSQEADESGNQNHPLPYLNVHIVQDGQTGESDSPKNFMSRLRESRQLRLRSFQEALKERLDNLRARSSSDSTSIYKFNFDLPTLARSHDGYEYNRMQSDPEPTSASKFSPKTNNLDETLVGNGASRSEVYQQPGFFYYKPRATSLARARRTPVDMDRQQTIAGEYRGDPGIPPGSSNMHRAVSGQSQDPLSWLHQSPSNLVNINPPYGQRSLSARQRLNDAEQMGSNSNLPDVNAMLMARRYPVDSGSNNGDNVHFDDQAPSDNLKPAGSYDRTNIYQASNYEERSPEACEQADQDKSLNEYEMPAKKVILKKEEKHHHHYHHHHHHHETKKESPKQDGSKKPASNQPVQLEIHIKGKGKGKTKSKGKGKGKKKEKGKMKEGDEIYVKFKQGDTGKQEKYSSSASGDHDPEQMDYKEREYSIDEKASLINDKEDVTGVQAEAKPLEGGGDADEQVDTTKEIAENRAGSEKPANQEDMPKTINTSQVPNHIDIHDESKESIKEKVIDKDVKKQKHRGGGLKKTSKRKEKKVTEEVEVEEVEEKKHGTEEKEPASSGLPKTSTNDIKKENQPVELKERTAKLEDKKPVVEKVEEKKIDEKAKPVVPAKEMKKDVQLHVKLGLEKSKHQHIEVHEHKHFENHQHINLHNQQLEEKNAHRFVEHDNQHQLEPYQHPEHPFTEDHSAHFDEAQGVGLVGVHDENHQVPINWIKEIHKPDEKHPFGTFVIEDHSGLEVDMRHDPSMSYTEETANHPHGFGLSPSGVRPLLRAFSNQVNVHVPKNETDRERNRLNNS